MSESATSTAGAAKETEPDQDGVFLRLLRREDLMAGLSMILISAFFLWSARDYPVGTTAVMGPGYFPRALCFILIGIGAAIFVNGFRKGFPVGDTQQQVRLLPLLLVPVSYVIFALTAQSFGLLLSGAILTMIAAFAYPGRSIIEAIVLTVALLFLSYLLWWAIGIQLPLLPRFL